MTVNDIVREYLTRHGYDGLVQPGICGCVMDDLFPCGNLNELCEPGYKGPCSCGEGCDWDIYSTKEAAKEAEEGAKG